MKKIFLLLQPWLLLTAALLPGGITATAQKGAAYEMTVQGVKVIVQPSGNQIVEIQTLIKGGVQNYPAAQQGIESLAMSALTECGTTRDDKNSFKNKLDKISARVSGSAGKDFSTISLNCIRGDFDAAWPLYADAISRPAFEQKEFDRIRQDAINGLRAQESQPDYAIDNMAVQTAFAGKNNAKRPEGTVATLLKLTATQTRAHYEKILTRSRMVIVVVGEFDRADLEQKISELLSTIPAGSPFTLQRESIRPVTSSFRAAKKDLATNYIQAVTGAPLPGSAEYNAFVLAMRIFSQRHFLEVRTKNGLSYAPGSWFDGQASASANISVSTTEPNKYIKVVKQLLDSTRRHGFTEDELRNMKTQYLTGFFYRQETNGAQASSLGANEVLHNNWRRALTISDDMKKVSTADLNAVFNKYMNNLVWVYQGNPAKANATLFTGKATKALPKPSVRPNKKN
jgi:predicted Zn-dependent peptidase